MALGVSSRLVIATASVVALATLFSATGCVAEQAVPIQPGQKPKSGDAKGSKKTARTDEARDTDEDSQNAGRDESTCEVECREDHPDVEDIDAKYVRCTDACTTSTCRAKCDADFSAACGKIQGCGDFVDCMNACP